MKIYTTFGIYYIIFIIFSSCAVGPEYQRPEMIEKKTWSETGYSELTPSQITRLDWWTLFNDAYLNELIQEATEGSFDLKILKMRIEEAGTSIKIARSALLPTLEASPRAEFTRMKFEGAPAETSHSYNVGGGVNWEIDLWGKNRRAHLATKAGYKAIEADYRAGYLKLVSEVAQSYFFIREIDEEITITQKSEKNNQQILDIYQAQYDEGLIPQWQVLRQEAQLKDLKKSLLELERNRKRLENRISTLLGKPAGEFKVPFSTLRDKIHLVQVPIGLPSELLLRRPDIVAAEYRLLESSHRIGEAEAARLPSLSMTSNGGLVSTALSQLLKQWTLGIAPNVNIPIFDGGRAKANAKKSKIASQIAADQYQKTVMDAFEEVENALINLDNIAKQKTVIEGKVQNLAQVRNQIHTKFKLGLISQLELLDIEKELLASELMSVNIYQRLLNDTVTLFKALGGGWSVDKISEKIN